ncbi:serine protease [Streptomyces sp. NBC_00063]|uniref:serine protease n=1 Tax=Streptomyces sp. NBC_00063 TaxID=2975638 RepID=UPI0022549511|nr:serine protease [Streptomyces sp. NBC_00063]MCX5440912.1 trypsin-like peptidase domain-containing protein [Streptomyces sp. NBC_00063]
MEGRLGFASAGLDPDRVAEVIVEGSTEPRGRRGSGYRIRAGFVLTAAHVVRDASLVRVRFRADRPGSWSADGTVLWRNTDVDVAIVAIAEAGRPVGAVVPVRFGGIQDHDGDVPCSTMGFPRHKLRNDPTDASHPGPPSVYRDSAHVNGTVSPWSNLREATLSIRVPAPEHDPDPQRSPWEGMSGAPVWSGGCLIGLVRSHHRSDGLGQLAASRVDHWYHRLDDTQLSELTLLIGLPPRDQLAQVALPGSSHTLRDEAVEALLRAEREASALQPYRSSGLRSPELRQVYVDQWADREPGLTAGSGTEPGLATERVPVAEVLNARRHVLIEGGPGTGKSTFTHHVSGTLASVRLGDEAAAADLTGVSAVAVRVPAGHLADDAPLTSLLHASVRTRLGIRLTHELPADLFAAPPHGVPWLLLVDGLDEILDPVARERVITTIARDAANPSSPYRWVVTTRPLPAGELAPLRNAGLGPCTLAAFDDAQLQTLAEGWLVGPSADESGRARVEEFLRQLDESELRQLVRAPLLATITLTIFHRRNGQGLPTGRPGLFREFIAYLLTGRDGEAERRRAFRQAAGAAGAGSRLAEWLYQNRVSLLQFLANRTLSTEASLLTESLAWVRAHAPDPPDFLVGWPDIILGLLTGTGLVTDADGTGELQWVHRSFAEYLAARDAAEALPSTWPGTDPHADALLREALEGVGQDQSALTLACWAEHRDTALARLLDFLIVWSDAYEVLLKRHGGGGVTVNDDSSRVDQYIALAGRLLAEGVPVPAAMSGQILDRLLIRARSIFNARYFCQLVAAQPQRERARNALMRMAHDNDLSGVIRADAALTVGRIFGLDVLHDATEPLLALDGSESFLYEEGGRMASMGISDVRAIIAYKISALGHAARPLANAFLDRMVLAEDDGWGRFLAAEAALAVSDSDRAASFITSVSPGAHRNIPGEVSVLLRTGRQDVAARTVDAWFASSAERDRWGGVQGPWADIQGIVDVYVGAGLTEQALATARRTVPMVTNSRTRVVSLSAVARAGDPAPGLDLLHTASLGNDRQQTSPPVIELSDWIMLARVISRQGRVEDVREAVNRRLMRDFRHYTERDVWSITHLWDVWSIAGLLAEIRDERNRQMLLWLARNGSGGPRRAAAAALLETDDRQHGIEALVSESTGPPGHITSAVELVHSLLLVGAEDQAVSLLHRAISDIAPDNSHQRCTAFDLMSWLRPAQARHVLLDLIRTDSLHPREFFCAVRNLLRLDERATALIMLRRVLDRPDPESTDLLSAASLFAWTGERADAIRAYERILEEATRLDKRSDSYFSHVVIAAQFLDSEGRLGAGQCEVLAAAAASILPWASAWRTTLLTVTGLLARNGATPSALALLTRALQDAPDSHPLFEEEVRRLRGDVDTS